MREAVLFGSLGHTVKAQVVAVAAAVFFPPVHGMQKNAGVIFRGAKAQRDVRVFGHLRRAFPPLQVFLHRVNIGVVEQPNGFKAIGLGGGNSGDGARPAADM